MNRKSFISDGMPKASFIRNLLNIYQGTGIVITPRMAENIYHATLKDPERFKDILIEELVTYTPNIRALAKVNIFNPEEASKFMEKTNEELDYSTLDKYIKEEL